jgi:8-oxo-dGTP pyrophosphatase MutT (NUDIX family)
MTYPFPDVDGHIPAATVVVFRNAPAGGPPELLMVQRAKEMRFAGGAAVFPGGRIDPEDAELARRIDSGSDIEVLGARIAGVRETLEETGLAIGLTRAVSAAEAANARSMLLELGALAPVLERFGWTLEPERLVPFARWCPRVSGTFDTRFFLADLGTGAVDITVDATENTRLFWASAAKALELADRGEISVIFPTRRNLDRLALFGSFTEARAQCEAIPVVTVSPNMEERDGEKWLVIPDYEARGYPIEGQPLATAHRG